MPVNPYTREERQQILDTLLRSRAFAAQTNDVVSYEHLEASRNAMLTPIPASALTPEEEFLSTMTLEECQQHIARVENAEARFYRDDNYRILFAPPLEPIATNGFIDEDAIKTITVTLKQLRKRRNELLQTQEYPSMATTLYSSDTSATSSYNMFSTTATATRPAIIRSNIFNMRENIHEIELRELRNKYRNSVFQYDFQVPPRHMFYDQRMLIRDAVHSVRRMQAMRVAYLSIHPRYKRIMANIIGGTFSNRDQTYICAEDAVDVRVTRTYLTATNAVHELQSQKAYYYQFKRQYGSLQAEHNQRAAMIRQKPQRYISIDTGHLTKTLMTWDNVWAVGATIDANERCLYLRVGLCNIEMNESAPESYYENPQAIRLAPFFVTVKLSDTGKAICSSRNLQTCGLSRQNNPGTLGYDIHPHQLSDQPCFGTYGQTLIDSASKGDLLSYVAALIGFYSQYNSQDSAGISAQMFHPANMRSFESPEEYYSNLYATLILFNEVVETDEQKIKTAIQDYADYHATEGLEQAPMAADGPRCADCGDEPVGNDADYYIPRSGERVCPSCWEDHYCGDCERHMEDCRCENEDDGAY